MNRLVTMGGPCGVLKSCGCPVPGCGSQTAAVDQPWLLFTVPTSSEEGKKKHTKAVFRQPSNNSHSHFEFESMNMCSTKAVHVGPVIHKGPVQGVSCLAQGPSKNKHYISSPVLHRLHIWNQRGYRKETNVILIFLPQGVPVQSTSFYLDCFWNHTLLTFMSLLFFCGLWQWINSISPSSWIVAADIH